MEALILTSIVLPIVIVVTLLILGLFGDRIRGVRPPLQLSSFAAGYMMAHGLVTGTPLAWPIDAVGWFFYLAPLTAILDGFHWGQKRANFFQHILVLALSVAAVMMLLRPYYLYEWPYQQAILTGGIVVLFQYFVWLWGAKCGQNIPPWKSLLCFSISYLGLGIILLISEKFLFSQLVLIAFATILGGLILGIVNSRALAKFYGLHFCLFMLTNLVVLSHLYERISAISLILVLFPILFLPFYNWFSLRKIKSLIVLILMNLIPIAGAITWVFYLR